MSRVAIIGNGGGGKTTLAYILAERYGLPLFEVDAVQWKPGWERERPEVVARWHAEILRSDKWLIDGWGSWELISQRFERADTIVFIDFPLWIHYWWACKRQVTSLFHPRLGGPKGCPLPPVTRLMFQTIRRIHHEMRPTLVELVENAPATATLHRITSPKAWRLFKNEHCAS